MSKREYERIPVSQQAHVVDKPKDLTAIGGMVSVQINEKKITVPNGTVIFFSFI